MNNSFGKSIFAKIFFLILFVSIFSINISAQDKLTDFVDPMIGTDGHGHTFPGASLPHGMVQLSPDTDIEGWDWCSGYHFSDNTLMGFSHTHLSGTGVGDYGDILFMPTTGNLQTEPGSKANPDSGYRSRFNHKNEIAKAGYYSVILDDYKIKAELTATTRAGFHKYIFPKTENANIIIDLAHGIQDKTTDSEIKIVDNKTIEGYRRSTGWAKDHCIYFYAKFSKPFTSFGIVQDGKNSPKKSTAKGENLKAYVQYSTSSNEAVLIKVGISAASLEGAKKNLQAEIPGWDFEKITKQAQDAWEKELSLISVKSKSKKDKTIYYTALYHALLAPNIFSDVDGNYIGMDNKIHTVKNHDMYTVFSLWDTFRAEHPLFTLIEKQKDLDMVRSLIAKYKENGLLPVWELASNETGTMIGYHSIPVIVDAYFKGINDFDAEVAFEAMKKSAMQDHLGLKYYKEMGYIPADLESESVSKTLAYSYDDWCIAKMAKALGKDDDYKYFIERAKFYSNVFDPTSDLMRAKKNGKWVDPFDPFSVSGDYTEANAWQYSFFVPQDVNGLIKLIGGDEKFVSKLDELFTTNPKLTGRFQSDITGMIGQYAQGNEPSHHMAYLYNYAGQPWKTQKLIHQIVSTLYTDKADGLCGNEDCGQMSAWYILSSVGLYQVTPGTDIFVIGTPNFDEVTINTGGNKKFTVKANNLSDKNFYIQSAKLNGKDYPYTYIKYSDIVDGGEIDFEMGSEPGNWGTDVDSRPTSLIDNRFLTVPYLTSGERVFKDSVSVGLSSIDNSSKIFYTTDGSDPKKLENEYSKPIEFHQSGELKSVCYKDGIFSKVVTSNFNKITEGRSIILNTQFHHSYTGGGALGLIDGIKGTNNFHTDAWQGYEGNNLDAVVDLGKIENISHIGASFLQNTGSWIFYPTEIEYYISTDGKAFTKVFDTKNIEDKAHSENGIKEFDKKIDDAKARYVKVVAKNVGVCPPWHVAAGSKAWLFVDEITIN